MMTPKKAKTAQRNGDKAFEQLTKDSVKYLKARDWSEYRNTRYEMAEQLFNQQKHEAAISLCLEVCFYDINIVPVGINDQPSDVYRIAFGSDPLRPSPVASTIMSYFKRSLEQTGKTLDDVKDQFFTLYGPFQKLFRYAFCPEEAWQCLQQSFEKYGKPRR